MRSTKSLSRPFGPEFALPVVSTLLSAALAVAPYNVALATAPAAEEAPAEAAEDADAAPADEAAPEDGGKPAAEDGGEPAAEDGGETPAEGEDGAEDAGETPEPEPEAEPEAEPEPEAAPEPEAEPEAAPEPSYVPEEEDDGRPEEPKINGKPARGTGLMIAGGTLVGLGVAFTTTMSLITRNCSYDGPLQCKLQNQDTLFIPMGVTAMVGGMILLGLGVGFRLRHNRWEKWTPGQEARIVPMLSRQTAGLGYTARF